MTVSLNLSNLTYVIKTLVEVRPLNTNTGTAVYVLPNRTMILGLDPQYSMLKTVLCTPHHISNYR